MKYILFAFMLLAGSACHPVGSATKNFNDSSKWINASLERIGPFEHEWHLSGLSGGSSIEGAHSQFSITPNSKSIKEAKSEFRAAVRRQLENDGYKIKGEGSGKSGNNLTSFSFAVESNLFAGTVMVVFETPEKDIPGMIAIAQVPRH